MQRVSAPIKKINKRNEKKVCIIGSGNSGSALAKIVATNCSKLSTFQDEVTMYVYEETIDERKLTDIINETHENVKYLPGRNLGPNVVAVADVVAAAREADLIVFAFPHRQISTVCAALLGKTKHSAVGLVMIKGFEITENGRFELASRTIGHLLKIQTWVLTGLAFPGEAVSGMLSEITIGCKCKKMSAILADVIQTETLRVAFTDDVDTVELCGTLRTLVACAAGIVDGLGQKYNCKAAIFRLGLIETVKFMDLFYPEARLSTVLESGCLSDLLLSCFYGRDRRVSEALVRTGSSLVEVERDLLNGVKLVGARVAQDVYHFLRSRDMEMLFPLFTAVHRVFTGDIKPEYFLTFVQSHPEHNLRLKQLPW